MQIEFESPAAKYCAIDGLIVNRTLRLFLRAAHSRFGLVTTKKMGTKLVVTSAF